MLLPEQALLKIDDKVPVDVAALVGCAVTTGLGAVFNTAKVPPGATVAVIGCGGIGLNVVQGAVVAGAARVIAVDVAAEKLDRARTFGATDTVDATAGDPVGQVQELTRGGVEYSFEALGRKATSEQAFAMLAPGGTATIIGLSPMGHDVRAPGARTSSGRRRSRARSWGRTVSASTCPTTSTSTARAASSSTS